MPLSHFCSHLQNVSCFPVTFATLIMVSRGLLMLWFATKFIGAYLVKKVGCWVSPWFNIQFVRKTGYWLMLTVVQNRAPPKWICTLPNCKVRLLIVQRHWNNTHGYSATNYVSRMCSLNHAQGIPVNCFGFWSTSKDACVCTIRMYLMYYTYSVPKSTKACDHSWWCNDEIERMLPEVMSW